MAQDANDKGYTDARALKVSEGEPRVVRGAILPPIGIEAVRIGINILIVGIASTAKSEHAHNSAQLHTHTHTHKIHTIARRWVDDSRTGCGEAGALAELVSRDLHVLGPRRFLKAHSTKLSRIMFSSLPESRTKKINIVTEEEWRRSLAVMLRESADSIADEVLADVLKQMAASLTLKKVQPLTTYRETLRLRVV